MTTAASNAAGSASAQKDDSSALLDALKARLEGLKRDVVAEIHAYPAPIPRCDAQFNHLLEERDRILDELRRLAELQAWLAACSPDERSRAAREFVAVCPFAIAT